MKKVLFAIGLTTTFFFVSCDKKKEAPQAVQTAMEQLYPGISKIDWDNEDTNMWEAEFKNSGVETSVTFFADGKMKEIEEKIAMADFPKTGLDYLKQNYPKEKVEEMVRLTDANGTVTYEIEVKDSEFIFDTQGNLMQKDKKSNL